MPTFDFCCATCNSLFEKTLPFGSKTKPACPECGSKKTEKQLSMPSIAFKGSGFYKTDSKPVEKTSVPEKKADPKPASADSGKTSKKS